MMHQAHFLLKYKLHHLFFWMLLAGVWFLLRYEDYATGGIALTITLLKVADLALMVYLTNYLLIPKLLYKRKFWFFGIVFVLMIVASSFIKMNITAWLTSDDQLLRFEGNVRERIYNNLIPHFFLVIAGAAIKLMFDQISLQKKMADLAKEKAEAELNFLKSQINPHFLFNSLNSVYFLINKNNSQARQVLHKFSDMLRYQLYEANGEKIPIEKEIAYLKDYVDLQKLRKDENYDVQFNCSPEVKGFSIEPLLLIPFVENAFKHISHRPRGNNYVKLDMSKQKGYFDFRLENSREHGGIQTDQSGGIGLGNVKRRLELLYPGAHELEIGNDDEKFKINLKLKI